MSTTDHRAAESVPAAVEPQTTPPAGFAYGALAVLRIAFGLTFLWAFFDKLLALGFSTGRADDGTVDRFGDAAWINGGSPSLGFLKFGADGPFKDFYNGIAGAAWVDVLFMAGLLGIGRGPHPRDRDAGGHGGRRNPLRDDVDRRAAAGEPPGARRPPPRRDQHAGPGRLLRR